MGTTCATSMWQGPVLEAGPGLVTSFHRQPPCSPRSNIMSAFIAAMDQRQRAEDSQAKHKSFGENGAAEYSREGVGDPRVSLFFKLVRGLSDDGLDELMTAVHAAHAESGDVHMLVDLCVMTFQTRATRGDGKGEKKLFLLMLLRLHRLYPRTVEALVELVPHYGYFKDWLLLAETLDSVTAEEHKAAADTLTRRIITLYVSKIEEDAAKLKEALTEGRTPSLSLAAKWAPRENKHFASLAKRMAVAMFPTAQKQTARALYRKRVAELNGALKTTETLMSAHRFAEIEWGRVASLAMNRNRKAFLNENVKGHVAAAHEDTGNRFPEDEDRVAARKALRAVLASAKADKLKGKALQPHEIVTKIKPAWGKMSAAEDDVLNAQWNSLREDVRAQLAKAKELQDAEVLGEGAPTAPKATVDLGKLVALVDVSASMTGTPMEVAIALGILTSELTAPAFRHRVLTFETHPQWVTFDAEAGIAAKTRQARHAPWGGSTDFAAALEMILEVAQTSKLKADEIPDLIVFSDMQFNQAGGARWETHLERIRRRFAEVGRKVCGEAYPAPRIIFWNLRANTKGSPATSESENVQLLSGFSPSLLKLVLTGADLVGDEVEVEMSDGTTKVVKQGPTPFETLRKALDGEAFDVVREVISRVGEGPFEGYTFEIGDGFEAIGPGA
mmetsp:Transcript_15086/g.36772  ORF Transcript_15086/g.36772 Transcript_15086/m.36772 type:complete len:673 (-) Transcript_15086:394-2412(-)